MTTRHFLQTPASINECNCHENTSFPVIIHSQSRSNRPTIPRLTQSSFNLLTIHFRAMWIKCGHDWSRFNPHQSSLKHQCRQAFRFTNSCHWLLPHSVSLCLCHTALPLSCHLLALGCFVLLGILYRHGHARTMFSSMCDAWLLSFAWSITGPGTIFVIWVRLCQVLGWGYCKAVVCWPSSPWISYYHGGCAIACVACVVIFGFCLYSAAVVKRCYAVCPVWND